MPALADVNSAQQSDAQPDVRSYNFLVNVDETLSALLQQEDTDNNKKITVLDKGPKSFFLRSDSPATSEKEELKGAYQLANLLEQLQIAKENGQKEALIPSQSLTGDPAKKLLNLISTRFWPNLVRRLDESAIEAAAFDAKDRGVDPRPRIYVPHGAPEQFQYYKGVAERKPDLNLDVRLLPEEITDDVYRELNKRFGILALELEKVTDPATGKEDWKGLPYVVPGDRFNELYNWDSYFIALGLLADGRVDLVKSLIRNFIFQIQHYGLIPNANRSYYLLRSQPPFLTDLVLRTYELTKNEPGAKEALHRGIAASIKEYHTVWVSKPRLDEETGLSRYRPAGVGVPPECRTKSFKVILQPFADKYKVTIDELRAKFDAGEIEEEVLEDYFLHDRGLRESGHDISLRVENNCADLAIIDLNSLLYKFETDIAHAIDTHFGGTFTVPEEFRVPTQHGENNGAETASTWLERAEVRKAAVDKYLWNEEKGLYLDYNTKTKQQIEAESVTSFWPLWCGLSSTEQAAIIVSKSLQKFENIGGLSSTSEASLKPRDCHADHQWDYPYGWAPHQVLAWDGLKRYGYEAEAERLAYKWLYLITKTFSEFNGTVVEKYNVTDEEKPHEVYVGYGNQGLEFEYYPKEGFGWTNASYVYGYNLLGERSREALAKVTPPSVLFK